MPTTAKPPCPYEAAGRDCKCPFVTVPFRRKVTCWGWTVYERNPLTGETLNRWDFDDYAALWLWERNEGKAVRNTFRQVRTYTASRFCCYVSVPACEADLQTEDTRHE